MKATKIWILIVLPLILAINVRAWPIPDTGQTKCYNNYGEIACPKEGQPFYGQDGSYNINPPSYTKLDATGNVLPDNAESWVMVRDNITGLVWENKTSDGSIHERSKTFTWCDKNPVTNGGYQGTCGTGTGNAATDTAAFIKALNDAKFGGFSDWRIPHIKELGSIVHMGRTNPALNTTWLPSTMSDHYLAEYYWSATSYANGGYYAWYVKFFYGFVDYYGKTDAHAVRAVRGGQPEPLNHFLNNGDGTVTDTATGLMWERGTSSMTWEAALAYAEGLTLAGYDDWRLPTPKELQSIVDYSRSAPAIDTALFPGTVSSKYWSSTTDADIYVNSPGIAWYVNFSSGFISYESSKRETYAVRAVRGGQPRLLGDLDMNGVVNVADAIMALQILSSSKTVAPVHRAADVDGDNKIGVAEAIYVLQCIARLRNNHSPVLATIGNKSVDESSSLTFTLSATDEDNDPLTFSVSSLPSDATFNVSTKTFSWTPTYSQSGFYPVTFTVNDGFGGEAFETINITVIDKVPIFTASEYYPLNVGDWKDYDLNMAGNIKRSSVIGTKIIGGVTTKISSDSDGNKQYYTSDQNGVKLYGRYLATSALEANFNPPILLMPNNAQIGTSNVSTSQYSFIYSGYTYHVNVTSTVIILGLEDIQTEHSLLLDCIKVSWKTDQYVVETGESVPGNTSYYWFYKGVGAVKQIVDGDTSTITSSSINGVQRTY